MSIFDKEKWEEFAKHKPKKKDYEVVWVYHKGEVVLNEGTLYDFEKLFNAKLTPLIKSKGKYNGYIIEVKFNEDDYKNDLKIYSDHKREFIEEYIKMLYSEYTDIISKDALDLLYAQAWENEHSYGYEAVEEKFHNVVDDYLKIKRVDYGNNNN